MSQLNFDLIKRLLKIDPNLATQISPDNTTPLLLLACHPDQTLEMFETIGFENKSVIGGPTKESALLMHVGSAKNVSVEVMSLLFDGTKQVLLN